ncbi:hypothetical protein ACFXDO_10730 [Streptomyces nigra]|uniref:hypothetical protein n=1 Tax=Streptomyces nigra TaxID=1827580 RepID=UPI0036B4EC35
MSVPGGRLWRHAQGREVFEGAVADPDSLPDLPVVRACAADGVVSRAGTSWDFEDAGEMARRLPRLAGLFLE